MIFSVRNLFFAFLISIHANFCSAESPDWILRRLECHSALEEFFGDQIEYWNIVQFQENLSYSRAHQVDNPSINPISLVFYKTSDNKQCLILQLPFIAKFKFSATHKLNKVIAHESVHNVYTTPAKEIIFVPGDNSYFVPRECKLNYFLSGKSKKIPCGTAPSKYSHPEGSDLILFPPSFDCARAYSKPEELICSSAKLAILDIALSKNYKSIKSIIAVINRIN
jgi:hypothetical protein